MGGDLKNETTALEILNLKRIQNWRKVVVSNWTSTTAPMTVLSWPMVAVASVAYEHAGNNKDVG
jgi:hypothetical protein